MQLLDRAARRLLDRMRIHVRRNATSGRQGGHLSRFRSEGIEFADHRQYVPGDDVRHIDWKAFARHGHLTLRVFEEEKDAHIHVLLDVTGSMSRGEPPKIALARQLAAAFIYVGMKQFDRARVIPFADTVDVHPLAVRSPADLPELERFLSEEAAAGVTAFPEAVRELGVRGLPRGLVVVVSDLMTPDGWEEGFRGLGNLGHELRVIHVGCKEDVHPDFQGELELCDAENDERVRLRVGKGLLTAYEKEVKGHLEECRDAVKRAGGRFIDVDVQMKVDVMLKRALIGPGAK